MAVLLGAIVIAPAVAAPSENGDWFGLIGGGVNLPIVLHVAGQDSYIESPTQSPEHIPAAISHQGQNLVVDVKTLDATMQVSPAANAKTLTGQFAQNGQSFPVRLTRTPPDAPKRPQRPKPPWPYESRDVTFRGGQQGVTLAGTYTRPNNDKTVPGVVLIGGSGPTDRDATNFDHKPYLVLADALTRAGFAVLRYDKRCVHASTCKPPSLVKQVTGNSFANDARAAVDWLASQPHVATQRIGLIGHSEGGEIAPMVADHDQHVAFVVLLSAPGVPGRKLLPEQARRIAAANGASQAAQTAAFKKNQALIAAAGKSSAGAARRALHKLLGNEHVPTAKANEIVEQLTLPIFRWLILHNPGPALAALKQPVLVIAGGRDVQVPVAQNLPPIEAALKHNTSATFLVYENMNHMLQPAQTGSPSNYQKIETTIEPAVLHRIVGWCRQVAMARPG